MSNDIRGLATQQRDAGQRNIDKDGIFLTENYGGMNTESSPVNMPLTDSPAMMNVQVDSSGKLRKRRGSRLMTDNAIGRYDQHIPVKLINGKLIHVCLGLTGLSVQPEGYDNPDALYTVANIFPPVSSHVNTSWETTKDGDHTNIYFAREGFVPIVVRVVQVFASQTGTAVTVPAPYFSGDYRDTSKVTNCKFLASNGNWYSFSSINASTGAGVLSADPGSNGVGVFVSFMWYWIGETMWRDKGHIYAAVLREHANYGTSPLIELPSKMKQHLIASYGQAKRDKNGQWVSGGSGARARIASVGVANVTKNRPFTSATSLVGYSARIAPQIDAANVSDSYWITGGQPVRHGAYSTVSGNLVSTDDTGVYLTGVSHIQFGGIKTTDAAYSVPSQPESVFIHSELPLPFNGGSGALPPNILVRTDVATYTAQTGTRTLVDTGNIYSPRYAIPDGSLFYTDQVPNTATPATWMDFTLGQQVGIFGDSMLATHTLAPAGFVGTAAVSGANDISRKDGGYEVKWGLSTYMNYKTGAFASVVGSFQDRLLFAGFQSNPNLIVFSNTGNNDETTFKQFTNHRSFDCVYSDPELATSPVEISLNLSAGEIIVDTVQWYDDLFVGTNLGVYRIHGGENLSITPTNFFVSKVASVGTIRNGMVLTTEGVMFLSESGVYKVYLDINTGAYDVTNVGLKIRPEITKGMSGTRFNRSVGRIAYDNTANVLYVLVGDEVGSVRPRRCFVYYMDREAWSEWGMYDGYMNASTVACIDGRLFISVVGDNSTTATMGEFNFGDYFTDLLTFRTLKADADIGYDLDQPFLVFNRSDYPSNSDVVLSLEGLQKLIPVTDVDSWFFLNNLVDQAVPGVDYFRRRNNLLYVNGTNYWTGIQTLYGSQYQNEENPNVLNVYSTSDEGWMSVVDLNYTDLLHVRTTNTDYVDEQVVLSLSYPTWWVSPSFTRNDVKDLKRMKHFYGIFENSLVPLNRNFGTPVWWAENKFSVSIIQNGTLEGQVSETTTGSLSDLTAQTPAWLDYYRVVLPIKGNFISFQACVHSFNRGSWELVGYQIETDAEGRTSRRAYNE